MPENSSSGELGIFSDFCFRRYLLSHIQYLNIPLLYYHGKHFIIYDTCVYNSYAILNLENAKKGKRPVLLSHSQGFLNYHQYE